MLWYILDVYIYTWYTYFVNIKIIVRAIPAHKSIVYRGLKNYNLDEVHGFYSRKLLFGSLKILQTTQCSSKKTCREICLILIWG